VAVDILERAIINCRGIVATPAPRVAVKSITGACGEFEMTFFVEELSSALEAQNELFDLIFRHLTVAGIDLASPQILLTQVDRDQTSAKSRSQPEIVLELVAIFSALTCSERAALAAKLRQHSYDNGDTLLQPGTLLQSLFFIGSGVVSLAREEMEGERELLRLGPGDHFGEIGLLTGAPSNATITALTPVVAYELAKADLAPVLEARSEVAQELSRALARRQATSRGTATEFDATVPASGLTKWFSERIHRLYNLASAE
jgi:CRP-like cAMP-binding protein